MDNQETQQAELGTGQTNTNVHTTKHEPHSKTGMLTAVIPTDQQLPMS